VSHGRRWQRLNTTLPFVSIRVPSWFQLHESSSVPTKNAGVNALVPALLSKIEKPMRDFSGINFRSRNFNFGLQEQIMVFSVQKQLQGAESSNLCLKQALPLNNKLNHPTTMSHS
jgi:hypothetical protein